MKNTAREPKTVDTNWKMEVGVRMRKRSYWWPNNVLLMTKRFGFGWVHVTEENAGMSSPNGLDSKLNPSEAFNKKQNQIFLHVFCPGSGEWCWNIVWSLKDWLGTKLLLFDHYLIKFCQVWPSFAKFDQVWPGLIKLLLRSLPSNSVVVSRDAGPEKASLCAIITFYYSLQTRGASFTVEFAIFQPVFFAEIAVNIRRKICNDRIIHDDI